MTLPDGWAWTRLGDLVSFAPKRPLSKRESAEHCTFIPMGAVAEETGVIDTSESISFKDGLRKSLTFFNEGDVLFAKVTPCMENGKIAVARNLQGGSGFGSSEFHVLTPNELLDADFLRYYLVAADFRHEASMSMTGAVGLRRVPKSFLEQHPFPLPPLDEQRRIVATLEDHLSRLDKALADTKGAKSKLAALRHSMLEAVFSGAKSVQGESWIETTLGEVAKWSSGGTPKTSNSAFYGGTIPWCVIGDLTESEVNTTAQLITELGLASCSAKLVEPGTVLLAMYGASIGRTGIAAQSMATNQAIACASVRGEVVHSEYLLLFLQSQKRKFVAAGKGGAQPNISQGVIKAWEIRLPNLEEQRRLVGLVAEFDNRHQSALSALDELFTKAENMRRSLLNSAFNGTLVQ